MREEKVEHLTNNVEVCSKYTCRKAKEANDRVRQAASIKENWDLEVLTTHDQLREQCAGAVAGMPTTAPVDLR